MTGGGDPVGGDLRPGHVLACGVEGGLIALDGEHVVGTSGGDLLRGLALGMHRVHRHDSSGEVEESQEPLYCWDFVALRSDRDLSEHGPCGVVERSDQVRCGSVPGPCAAHCLAVDCDHPPPVRRRRLGPHVRAQGLVQGVGFQTSERASDRGLFGTLPSHAELGQGGSRLVSHPLADRHEGTRAGQHRCQTHRQDRGQWMLEPAWVAGIGHRSQQAQQIGSGRRATCGHGRGRG